MPTPAQKFAVVNAIWLVSYLHGQKQNCQESKLDTAAIIKDAAAMLGKDPARLFDGFDGDWADRAWCSRPPDWRPEDSLARLQPAEEVIRSLAERIYRIANFGPEDRDQELTAMDKAGLSEVEIALTSEFRRLLVRN